MGNSLSKNSLQELGKTTASTERGLSSDSENSLPEWDQAIAPTEKCVSSDSEPTEKSVKSAAEDYEIYYPALDEITKIKLNGIFEEANRRASLDYSNQEILDIQVAVHTMLERIATRINERGVFKISRIKPCGSMAEKTTVWKYSKKTGERYTEFDFLAVIEYPPEIIRPVGGCRQCVGVIKMPVHGNTLNAHRSIFLEKNNMVMFDLLFVKELNTCFGSACDCFFVEYDDNNVYPSYSYKTAEECDSDYRCDKCVVEMPTGILGVNHSVSVGKHDKDANCSLAFRWTSTANTLSVCGKLLGEEAEHITSLSIHVDFLPALEILKDESVEDAREHDFFLVPKHCNGCRANEQWRKSNCMAEIKYIVHVMSEKHKKCFKIIKYFLSRFLENFPYILNWYYVKTVALNHSRECLDSSEACAECVLKMLTELKLSYRTKSLNSFHDVHVNMFQRDDPQRDHMQFNTTADGLELIFQQIIKQVCCSKED